MKSTSLGSSSYIILPQSFVYVVMSQVKYFDRKRIYDDYKKKLEEEGYKPLEIDIKGR